MGLGLSVSLNVIQAHNAAVDVSSSPDTGTKFTITFPAIHAS
jgi:Signal transduction histidine kinase